MAIPELGQDIGRDFVAQTPKGTLAEVRITKVHEGKDMSLENISARKGGYNALFRVSALIGLVQAGIAVESFIVGHYAVIYPDLAIYTVGVLGAAGAMTYFDNQIRDCTRKIEQIKNNRIPNITR